MSFIQKQRRAKRAPLNTYIAIISIAVIILLIIWFIVCI
jgi:hypothetical protein